MTDVIVLPRSAAKQPEPYNGHDIILTEGFKFAVVFEDETHPIYCDSLREAHEKIDARAARLAKQNKAKETCKLPYAALGLDNKLHVGIVKGFHATQGHVLTDNKLGDATYWYPDTPLIREQLRELGALRTKMRNIDNELRPFKLSAKPVYGRTEASRYDEVLQGIVKDYEVKKAKAHAAAIKTA